MIHLFPQKVAKFFEFRWRGNLFYKTGIYDEEEKDEKIKKMLYVRTGCRTLMEVEKGRVKNTNTGQSI